ncbi:MAG: hypothetical protein ABIJ08_04940 [Nanoarchaeota archaeon]
MVDLVNLAIGYERNIVLLEGKRLRELTGNFTEHYLERNAENYSKLIKYAAKRNHDDKEGDLKSNDLEKLIVDIPGASDEQIEARKSIINARVLFYQHLLRVEGEFDCWEDMIRARYQTREAYEEALMPIINTENHLRDMLKTHGDEQAKSRQYAREKIAEICFPSEDASEIITQKGFVERVSRILKNLFPEYRS